MKGEFTFDGQFYTYFHHPHNTTWANERHVEIPIAWRQVSKHLDEDILEIGNVLPNYFRFPHTVIDKYESGHGVTTCDLFEYEPDRQFDFIVSVSTIEHVGNYKGEQKPELALAAIERIRQWVKPDSFGSHIFLTIPIGQNPPLTNALIANEIPYRWRSCMRRINTANLWEECAFEQIRYARYASPYPCGNAVVFLWL